MKKQNKNILVTFFRFLLYVMPLVLCFSYYPLIKLGENETMYFELSLPLIWLMMFDLVGFILVVRKYREKLFKMILGSIWWWMFPFFVSFSAIWSLNPTRAILTVGLMWILVFAATFMYLLRECFDRDFWRVFLRWFFGSALLICVWCVIQCILDVNGVSQDITLLCDGCTSQMFGFPHPNGFAIEPQFMGNLLLAPSIVSLYFYLNKKNKKYLILFAIFAAALFLTMSRGAIYALVVGICFLFAFLYFSARKTIRKKVCFSILKSIGIFVVAFLFALNLQGILAAASPTSDTYKDGVAKVLNQLSLGVIDIRSGDSTKTGESEEKDAVRAGDLGNSTPVENSDKAVENSETDQGNNANGNEAVFDGYVAESTDTRVRLFNAALTVWKKDFKTMMVGVGIGGAGQALYDNGLSPAPREIVQNEYASLLLETGVIGILLFGLLIITLVRAVLKTKMAGPILGLLVAYGVSLLFFSGLPNALQIVLLSGVLIYLSTTSPSTGSSLSEEA
ncbi:O-antigen ligase family protein [Candidatus Saccharibacteria bacterium]|nr:O-antigen ligase family protein [Candidatus Saccharibacteria bacterium]